VGFRRPVHELRFLSARLDPHPLKGGLSSHASFLTPSPYSSEYYLLFVPFRSHCLGSCRDRRFLRPHRECYAVSACPGCGKNSGLYPVCQACRAKDCKHETRHFDSGHRAVCDTCGSPLEARRRGPPDANHLPTAKFFSAQWEADKKVAKEKRRRTKKPMVGQPETDLKQTSTEIP